MKYRGAGIKAYFILYIFILSGSCLFTLGFFVLCLLAKEPVAFAILFGGIAPYVLFVFWLGKKTVKIVEVYEDKIVFIPFILRNKRKEIYMEEIKQICLVQELSMVLKRGLSLGVCKFYDFELKGDDKVYSIPPYRLESTPETDKIIEEYFLPHIPSVEVDRVH